MSRLGLVSAGEANVSVSSRSRKVSVSVSSFTSRAHPWVFVQPNASNNNKRYCAGNRNGQNVYWKIESSFNTLRQKLQVALLEITQSNCDVLFALIEVFSLGVTAEALRANID